MSAHRDLRNALGGLLVLGLALLGCKSKDDSIEKPAPVSQPLGADVKPAVAEIPAIARFEVSASAPSSDVWTPGFAAQLSAGNQGKNYLEAAQSCQAQGLQLCTETQYSAACAANAALAPHSSWTATWSGGSSVIARGGGGCSTRTEVTPSDRAASRTALCCERAIGIRTANKNTAFLKASHADLISYEKDFNGKSAAALSPHFADSISIDGAAYTKVKFDAIQARWFQSHPSQWTLYDVCDLSIGEVKLPSGKDRGLVAKCTTVTALKNSQVSVLTTHFGRFRAADDTRNRIVEMNHDGRLREMSPL